VSEIVEVIQGPTPVIEVAVVVGPQGPQGEQGEPGLHGAVWQGLWQYDVTYVVNDVVNYGGAAWIAKTVNIFKPCPDHPDDWDLFVDKGAQGDTGATGATGAAPWEQMTQAAYDAITPDPDTLYIIVG
jgi:hypothetical protein